MLTKHGRLTLHQLKYCAFNISVYTSNQSAASYYYTNNSDGGVG